MPCPVTQPNSSTIDLITARPERGFIKSELRMLYTLLCFDFVSTENARSIICGVKIQGYRESMGHVV